MYDISLMCNDSGEYIDSLTHIAEVSNSEEQHLAIKKLKRRHRSRDERVQMREEIQILEEYLLKHSREFRHTYCCPINKVYNPIHDQAYYLTLKHNQEAKRGVWLVSAYLCVPINCYRYEIVVILLGVEPWTFEQHSCWTYY
ncbi:hypothetical protein Hanom_Chr02g00123011 [Helianthus anomalus]